MERENKNKYNKPLSIQFEGMSEEEIINTVIKILKSNKYQVSIKL